MKTPAETLREIVEFAYQQGFHEVGYDPIAARDAEVREQCRRAVMNCSDYDGPACTAAAERIRALASGAEAQGKGDES